MTLQEYITDNFRDFMKDECEEDIQEACSNWLDLDIEDLTEDIKDRIYDNIEELYPVDFIYTQDAKNYLYEEEAWQEALTMAVDMGIENLGVLEPEMLASLHATRKRNEGMIKFIKGIK